MAREQRSESLDSVVTDDSEDPLTCPLTQRLFHDPVILVKTASKRVFQARATDLGVPRVDETPRRDHSTPSTRREEREAQESKLVQPNLPLRERLAPLRPRAKCGRSHAEGGAERVGRQVPLAP